MYIMLIAALCVAVALDYEQNTLVGLTWILEQLCKMQSWQDNHFLDEETEVPSHAEYLLWSSVQKLSPTSVAEFSFVSIGTR